MLPLLKWECQICFIGMSKVHTSYIFGNPTKFLCLKFILELRVLFIYHYKKILYIYAFMWSSNEYKLNAVEIACIQSFNHIFNCIFDSIDSCVVCISSFIHFLTTTYWICDVMYGLKCIFFILCLPFKSISGCCVEQYHEVLWLIT